MHGTTIKIIGTPTVFLSPA